MSSLESAEFVFKHDKEGKSDGKDGLVIQVDPMLHATFSFLTSRTRRSSWTH